jgi:hypothetical protein
VKRGTPEHPKTHDLAARLGLEKWGAVGVVEALFHFAAAYARRGDVGRHSDTAIARAIGWTRDAGELVEALVAAGWLDRCECHRLRVHDWPDHADQTVARTHEVKQRGFAECYAGAAPPAPYRLLQPAGADSPPAAAETSTPLASDEDGTIQPLPSPLPLPSPTPGTDPPSPPARAGGSRAERRQLEDRLVEHWTQLARARELEPPGEDIRAWIRESLRYGKAFDDLAAEIEVRVRLKRDEAAQARQAADRIERRLVLVRVHPKLDGEGIEDYRRRIDALMDREPDGHSEDQALWLLGARAASP